MDNTKIGYKLGGTFEDMGVDGFRICFEILFPTIYKTKEEAESNNGNICAYMEKEKDKVVIKLYGYHILVQTIYWDEWWKYKCCRIKNKSKNAISVDALTDYEPYSASFEDIFKNYVRNVTKDIWSMQYLAYWVEPVLLGRRDQ